MSTTEMVGSTGSLGLDFDRSYNRAYYNLENLVETIQHLQSIWEDFRNRAFALPRRRAVLRARCTADVVVQLERAGLPVEAVLPLGLQENGNTDAIVMLGENNHRSEVPEWNEVAQYWQNVSSSREDLTGRLEGLRERSYQPTAEVTDADVNDLLAIWQPFGWTENGVRQFIATYQNRPHMWFAGIRNPDGHLVSACMAESLPIAGSLLVECTEFGTHPLYRERGLCTAAVTHLHAQILEQTLHAGQEMPLIVAEFNMTSRSDVVGRKTGYTIPNVEGNQRTVPRQVLHYNVAIRDGGQPNDLYELGSDETSDARFLRNFIIGTIPRALADELYSPDSLDSILNGQRRRVL